MKVYLIAGSARHGKDTAGNFIQEVYEKNNMKVCRTQIAKYLKLYVKDYFGWDGTEENKPRELLQQLGTDVIREKLGKDRFFVDRTIEDIEILQHFFDVMIITDIRFPIEIIGIKEKFNDVVAIHVKRINYETELTGIQQQHKSETALDNFDQFDYNVINDKLDDYEVTIKEIVNKEINNEKIN